MWTVISQKQKAKPGLAKILLALLLLACLIFAYVVQKGKLHLFRLDLDRTFEFSSRSGEISVSLCSKWKTLSRKDLLSGMVTGWNIPLPAQHDTASLYLDLLPVQPTRKRDFPILLSRYVLLDRPSLATLKIQEQPKINSLPNYDISLLFKGEQNEVEFMAMRLFFLPDGTSLALIFIGPRSSTNTLSVWLDKMAQTVNLKPKKIPPPIPLGDGPKMQTSIFFLQSKIDKEIS
ncbi:MAG: hypothetical protein WC975_04980 [Phycisphaerae bacterium]